MTTEGQKAYLLLDWANGDLQARVPEAAAKVNALAVTLMDEGTTYAVRALAEVRDAGSVLARLAGTLPAATGPAAHLAGGNTTRGQQLEFAAEVTVDPAAMKLPGLPVPADPAAISMFTAHRVNSILHQVAHASERMQAAQAAAGDLREYHVTHIVYHLGRALNSGREMTVNLREHYPPEAAELGQVKDTIGLAGITAQALDLAVAVSPAAKAVSLAHLLETTLHELTHASLHAQSMGENEPGGDEWAFNADHCASHIGGAVEHAGKIWVHLHDNYPAEARWLMGIARITHPADPQQHAGDDDALELAASLEEYLGETLAGEVAAWLGGTVSGQVDLASVNGHHVPGTAYTYRHDWIPAIGGQLRDKYPQWKIDRDKVRPAGARHSTSHARDAAAVSKSIARHRAKAAAGAAVLPPEPRRVPAMGRAVPPPAPAGSTGEKLAVEDPALASLAAPGMSAEAMKAYIDARVSVEVARQAGQIKAETADDLKAALAEMHRSQQATIALIRRQYMSQAEDDAGDERKHTVMNTLFAVAGVAVAGGAIVTGIAPILAALVAGAIPLANVIHDYVRGLG